MWVSVPYETVYSLSSLNSQMSSLITLQTCTPAYTTERGTGHIASANYPVTKRKKNLLATEVKANTPKESSSAFNLARRRKKVSGTSTRKSAVRIDPLLWLLVTLYHLSVFLKPFLFYPSCWTEVGFEDNNPISCQQFPFEENCHFVSIVGIGCQFMKSVHICSVVHHFVHVSNNGRCT